MTKRYGGSERERVVNRFLYFLLFDLEFFLFLVKNRGEKGKCGYIAREEISYIDMANDIE